MNCQKIKSLSLAYHQHELEDNIDRRDEITSHLHECKSCKAFYEFNALVLNQIQQDKQKEINPNLFNEIKAKIDKTNTKKSNSQILHYLKIVTTAAAIFIAIIGGNYIGNISAKTINEGFAEATSDEIIDLDMAGNEFDLFNDF